MTSPIKKPPRSSSSVHGHPAEAQGGQGLQGGSWSDAIVAGSGGHRGATVDNLPRGNCSLLLRDPDDNLVNLYTPPAVAPPTRTACACRPAKGERSRPAQPGIDRAAPAVDQVGLHLYFSQPESRPPTPSVASSRRAGQKSAEG